MIPKLEMLIPKNYLFLCACNSVDWTRFDGCFDVKRGFGPRI